YHSRMGDDRKAGSGTDARVCVFAPTPIVTVTIEARPDEEEELHLHAGGQGFWVARMVQVLGGAPVLCAPLGGETGDVLGPLRAPGGIGLRSVGATGSSGSYVHDRRGDERVELWRAPLNPLLRHEVDDLFTVTLAEALAAGVCVVAGTHEQEDVLPEGL